MEDRVNPPPPLRYPPAGFGGPKSSVPGFALPSQSTFLKVPLSSVGHFWIRSITAQLLTDLWPSSYLGSMNKFSGFSVGVAYDDSAAVKIWPNLSLQCPSPSCKSCFGFILRWCSWLDWCRQYLGHRHPAVFVASLMCSFARILCDKRLVQLIRKGLLKALPWLKRDHCQSYRPIGVT